MFSRQLSGRKNLAYPPYDDGSFLVMEELKVQVLHTPNGLADCSLINFGMWASIETIKTTSTCVTLPSLFLMQETERTLEPKYILFNC